MQNNQIINKMKLYSIYTEEANGLKDIFLQSIKDDWEINPINLGKAGEDGNWGTESFGKLMRKKIEYIIETVEMNRGNIIIISDIDIQFFRKCTKHIEDALETNDILFQSENWPEKRINAGFIVIRCNDITINFFKEVANIKLENLRFFEQSAMCEILEKDSIGLKWDVLPSQFWAMSHHLPPPNDIVLHHANCTSPIVRDGKKIGSIELKLEQYKKVQDYLSLSIIENKESEAQKKTKKNEHDIYVDDDYRMFESSNGDGGTLDKINDNLYKLCWNNNDRIEYMDLDLNIIHNPKFKVNYQPKNNYTNKKIVCVMTSWKPRINDVGNTISFFLKTQNIKPDKILLYLSSDEFGGQDETLPYTLIQLKELYEEFEIIWVKENYKTCKKLLYNPKEDEYLIIIDDDLYYFPEFLEKLIEYEIEFKCPVFFGSHIHYFRDPDKMRSLRLVPNFEHWGLLSGTLFTKSTYPYKDIQEYCFDLNRPLHYLNTSEETFMLSILIKNNQKSICILDCCDDNYHEMYNDVIAFNNAMAFKKGSNFLNTIKEYPHARIEFTFVELFSLIEEYAEIKDAYARNFPDFLKVCNDYKNQILDFKKGCSYVY